ncbi:MULTISPECIES: flagellar basal body P-ring protein FlgI [unclassified Helicobacter]|uniref:flagellar basal body P-ring protein FlgI n=1 Tax=unclassified Helicobacter TaxID=2593540 RepID=UPI001F5AE570|nr:MULTISPECIES: flagellar basal body P-ring protein FlgI [unclassified Helicobacter]MCI2235464.1 flagellar basal body P-ring protein FlgI [Helicobacter sp. CaF467b]MCI7047718.1 flagellar basal body P-ring protein FlgI [Helicobacter sp.]
MKKIISLLFSLFLVTPVFAAKVSDLVNIVGVRDNQLIGYGLVVGLNGSGDKTTSTFTMQSISNMLESVNVKIDPNDIQSKNVAAVMVTAKLPPFARQGDTIDILVSSIGDAKSLEGGTLLLTPLSGLDGRIYAVAQGAVGIGGKNERGGSANHSLAATMPNGGIVEREVTYDLYSKVNATLSLKEANFQNAMRIQTKINETFGASPNNKPIAIAIDPRTIKLQRPENLSMVEFLARVQDIDVDYVREDKIIINEKTGTVIAGMGVEVSPVVVTHNNITIKVSNEAANDPEAVDMGSGAVFSPQQAMVTSPNNPTISSVTRALQRMGATPKDMIAIIETMKKAGAFNADLEII